MREEVGMTWGWVGWKVVFLLVKILSSGREGLGSPPGSGPNSLYSGRPHRELELSPLSSAPEREGLCLHHPHLGLALAHLDL